MLARRYLINCSKIVTTSVIALNNSFDLFQPLVRHLTTAQASIELARRNKLINDTTFHPNLPESAIENMALSPVGKEFLIEPNTVTQAIMDKNSGYTLNIGERIRPSRLQRRGRLTLLWWVKSSDTIRVGSCIPTHPHYYPWNMEMLQ